MTGLKISDIKINGTKYDFKISAGRCLVRGFEVVNQPFDGEENPLDHILYSQQVDISELKVPATNNKRDEIVYLDVWIEEITSAEDDSLKNSRDVKVETCIRHKLEWRVRVTEEKDFQKKYEEMEKKEKHRYYYALAKITWVRKKISQKEDLRRTDLTMYLLRDIMKDLINHIATHSHSKLRAPDGSPDPALMVDKKGNVGIGTHSPGATLEVDGFTKSLGVSVNNRKNSGVGRGLWLWNPGDSNHVIYLANPKGKSPANKDAVEGYFNDDYRLRLRTAQGQGFLFENNKEEALVDIDASNGKLWTKGGIYAGNSSVFFTNTGYKHIGTANKKGWAAIENSTGWDALMILGRTVSTKPLRRDVKLWDYLQVNGSLDVTGNVGIGTTPSNDANRLEIKSGHGDWIYLSQDRVEKDGGGFHIHNPWRKGDDAKRNCLSIAYKPYNEDTKWGQFTIHGPTGNVGIGTSQPGKDKLDVRGHIYAEGGCDTSNKDYAEYFESDDGTTIPAGTPVALNKKGKIRAALKGEVPIGIISKNPAIVGNSYKKWPKKYLRDEFGQTIMEEYEEEIMMPKKEKVKKERQKTKKKKIQEKEKRTDIVLKNGKYCQVEIEDTVEREIEEPLFKEVDLYDAAGKNKIGKHRVPVMETYEKEIDVPDEKGQPIMVGTGKFEIKIRPKINPEYDPSKEYIARDERPEWNCVGLLGQLPLRKGQPTAPSWLKIKDISKNVELWLVK
jgi:hypothetical protein